jgi:hypothetical protein
MRFTGGIVLCTGGCVWFDTQPGSKRLLRPTRNWTLTRHPWRSCKNSLALGMPLPKKIIAGRPYKSVAELGKAGVPKPTIDKLAPLVTVGAESKGTSTPESAAKTPPHKGMVWVNTESGIFFREGDRWYGETKEGKFVTEADAKKAGYHETKR